MHGPGDGQVRTWETSAAFVLRPHRLAEDGFDWHNVLLKRHDWLVITTQSETGEFQVVQVDTGPAGRACGENDHRYEIVDVRMLSPSVFFLSHFHSLGLHRDDPPSRSVLLVVPALNLPDTWPDVTVFARGVRDCVSYTDTDTNMELCAQALGISRYLASQYRWFTGRWP